MDENIYIKSLNYYNNIFIISHLEGNHIRYVPEVKRFVLSVLSKPGVSLQDVN